MLEDSFGVLVFRALIRCSCRCLFIMFFEIITHYVEDLRFYMDDVLFSIMSWLFGVSLYLMMNRYDDYSAAMF
jgi:hypothetical protein